MRLNLKEARLSRFLTQEQLAELSGVSRATITNLEAGQGARITSVQKLAKALKMEPADLVIKETAPAK